MKLILMTLTLIITSIICYPVITLTMLLTLSTIVIIGSKIKYKL